MQWARQPQTDEHGGSIPPPPLGSTTFPLDSSLEEVLLWCGKGYGGGTHEGPLRIRGVLMAHCLILLRLCSLMSRWPSEGIQSTYRLYSSSASVFLRRALAWTTRCVNTRGSSAQKRSWILGTQYWQIRRGGLPGVGWREKGTCSGALWAGALGSSLALPLMHGGSEQVTPSHL